MPDSKNLTYFKGLKINLTHVPSLRQSHRACVIPVAPLAVARIILALPNAAVSSNDLFTVSGNFSRNFLKTSVLVIAIVIILKILQVAYLAPPVLVQNHLPFIGQFVNGGNTLNARVIRVGSLLNAGTDARKLLNH